MSENFVGRDLAKKLKEKGFKELCLAYYTNDDILYQNYSHKAGAGYTDCYLSHNLMPKDSVSGKFVDAPTIFQVLKWLREEKKIHISPVLWRHGWYVDIQSFAKEEDEDGVPFEVDSTHQSVDYETYEEAIIAGVNYCLENLI